MDLESPNVEIKTRAVDQRVQNLIQQARQGDVEAYYSLALCYRDGDGVEKSLLNMICMYAIYNQKTGGEIEDIIELLMKDILSNCLQRSLFYPLVMIILMKSGNS